MADTDREAVERLIFDCNSAIVALGRDILADCDFTLRALLDAKEAAEAERDVAIFALQDVVREYPVSAGTAKGIPADEQGYGSIYRARQFLAQINKETDDGK